MTDYTAWTTRQLEAHEDATFAAAMILADELGGMTTTDPAYRAKRDAFARLRKNHEAIAATLHARRSLDMAAAVGSAIIEQASTHE